MKNAGWLVAIAATLAASGCATSELPTGPGNSYPEYGLNPPAIPTVTPLTPLTVPTYDGSGQAVHPDVLWFPAGFRGFEYWMAFSPYPAGQERFENPSVVVSHDGQHWEVPPGGRNPLLRPAHHGYNSDPDLSFDTRTGRLLLLNREVRGDYNRVSAMYSRDGINWTAPFELFRRRNHGMISPSMVLVPGRAPSLWYVDAGPRKCPQRVTRVMRQVAELPTTLNPLGLERGWDRIRPAGLVQPGQMIWHIDVTWIEARQEYWAVYPAYQASGCGARDLFLARSRDGVTWTTFSRPLLRHGQESWTAAMLYRASMLYDPSRDVVRLFLSASAPGPVWRLGYVEFRYKDMLAALEGGLPSPRTGELTAEESDLP